MIAKNIRLVYFHGKSTLNWRSIDIKLSGKYCVKLIDEQYIVSTNHRFVDDYWNIGTTEITMLVGNNGGGKSDICNTIINFLCSPVSMSSEDVFLICEIDNTLNLILRENNSIEPDVCFEMNQLKTIKYDVSKKEFSSYFNLQSFQCIYFKPNLDELDYMRSDMYKDFYDASLGALIHQARSEQHDSVPSYNVGYINYRDDVPFYYTKELTNIVRFFSEFKLISEDLSEKGIKTDDVFRYPQNIYIRINDYNDYLRFLEASRTRIKEIPQIQPYRKAMMKIRKYNEESFSCILIQNIMVSILYLACPQIVPTSLEVKKEYERFCRHFLHLFDAINNYIDDKKLFEWAIAFLKELKEDDTPHIIPYIDDAIEVIKAAKPILDMCIIDNTYAKLHEIKLPFMRLKNEELDLLKIFMDKIRKLEVNYQFVSFEFSLSSGEMSIWRLFSKIFNAVDNKKYLHHFVMLDEPDMALHPEWQRSFLCVLEWFSALIKHKIGGECQFFITTHSPIMLTDMPMDNVVYIVPQENNKYNIINNRDFNTFGNAIFTLYNDAFFLNTNGQVGELASKWINNLIQDLQNFREEDISTEGIHDFEKKIDMIGEPVIRNQLFRMLYRKVMEQYGEINLVDKKIKETEEYLKHLRRVKEEYDTNQI